MIYPLKYCLSVLHYSSDCNYINVSTTNFEWFALQHHHRNTNTLPITIWTAYELIWEYSIIIAIVIFRDSRSKEDLFSVQCSSLNKSSMTCRHFRPAMFSIKMFWIHVNIQLLSIMLQQQFTDSFSPPKYHSIWKWYPRRGVTKDPTSSSRFEIKFRYHMMHNVSYYDISARNRTETLKTDIQFPRVSLPHDVFAIHLLRFRVSVVSIVLSFVFAETSVSQQLSSGLRFANCNTVTRCTAPSRASTSP